MEQYIIKPNDVDVYHHGGKTDIILRKNISQRITDDGTVWGCDEQQIRIPGEYSEQAICADFEQWWELASGEKALEYRVGVLETRTSDTEEALRMILERTTV